MINQAVSGLQSYDILQQLQNQNQQIERNTEEQQAPAQQVTDTVSISAEALQQVEQVSAVEETGEGQGVENELPGDQQTEDNSEGPNFLDIRI